MKKSTAKQIERLWNENFAGTTSATKTLAVVDNSFSGRNAATSWSVEIHANGEDNDGQAFFHNEEFADILRVFKVSGYVYIQDGKLVGRMY